MENEMGVTILPRTDDLSLVVSLVAVIFLLLWDVWKAWKRRAFWIPASALLLRSVIIYLVSHIYYSQMSVYSGSRYQTVKVIDSGGLMMCVLIAYLIPGIARSGSIGNGMTLAALALRITWHVVFEVLSDWKVEKRNESLSALAPSSEGLDRINSYLNHYIVAIILIPMIIHLLGLLFHAVMSGETISRSISQKITSALSCCTPCDRPRCNTTSCGGPKCKDIEDHVLKCWIVARVCQPDYVFSRSSLCSMLWPTVTSCLGFYIIIWIYIYNESLNSVETLVKLVIAGQVVLIGIGWIVLLVRWVTSDGQGNISGEYYISCKSLRDWQARFIGLFVWDKSLFVQKRMVRNMNRKFRVIQSLLWYSWPWVTSTRQWLSRITTRVIEFISRADPDDPQFTPALNTVRFGEEDVRSLWEANQWGFKKVERYMDQGHEDGRRSPSELNSLLRLGTVTADLRQANRNSWKRTAVSLIHQMIDIYDAAIEHPSIEHAAIEHAAIEHASVIDKAMQCYIQGWEYMDIVDGLNEEDKSLGRQADEEFDSLEHSWMQRRESRFNDERRNLQNSRDANNFLVEINRLKCDLANVYLFYMTQHVNKAVIQKCSELAEEGMEEEIFDVAVLAAKAQRVMDEVGEENNTGQASTSSHIPTGTELVGEGNGQAGATAKRIWDRFAHAVNTTLTKLKLQWWSKETTQTVYEQEVIGNGDKDNATDNV